MEGLKTAPLLPCTQKPEPTTHTSYLGAHAAADGLRTRVLPVLHVCLTHNPLNPQLAPSSELTLRLVDSSTHALLLAGHPEAGGDVAMVARVEQLLAASAPRHSPDVHECMDTWQRLGLELPEVRPNIPYPGFNLLL